jgi:hypothetical protein
MAFIRRVFIFSLAEPKVNRETDGIQADCYLPAAILRIWAVVRGQSTFYRSFGKSLKNILYPIGRYPWIVLSLPSLYLLLSYPILWKDIDALAQLIWRAGAINILHYPPLYCFGGRVPFWLDDVAHSALRNQPWPPLDLLAPQQPGLSGIYLLLIGQHLFLILALTFLIASASDAILCRGVLTLCTLGFSALYANQQCAGSESLSVVSIVLVAAFSIRIVKRTEQKKYSWADWMGYLASLVLAVGTRHINVVLGACLPLSLVGFGLCQGQFVAWKRIMLNACLGALVAALALLANVWLARSLIAFVGDEYRTITGIALSARIEGFLRKLPGSEREVLVRKLLSEEADPVVRAAILGIATQGSYEHGTDRIIRNALQEEGRPDAAIQAESERIITKAALAYLRTFHPKLVTAILSDFVHGFLRSTNGKLSRAVFLANVGAARLRQDAPEMWKPLAVLSSLDYRTAERELRRARDDFWLGFGGRCPLIVLLFLNVALAVVKGKRQSLAAVVLGLSASGVLLYLVNCIFIPAIERYALPLLVTQYAAFIAAVAAWRQTSSSLAVDQSADCSTGNITNPKKTIGAGLDEPAGRLSDSAERLVERDLSWLNTFRFRKSDH